jgi:hypothetical protein
MGMKFGLAGSTNGAGSSRQNNNLGNTPSNTQGKIVAARVTDIVLDENHKYYERVGQWNGIGAIFYEIVNQSDTKSVLNFALPYDSQLKTYPLINEIVLLISLPNQSMGLVSSNESYFYMSPLGIWNHPHHDAYPNVLDGLNDQAQQRDYQATSQGSIRQVTDGSTEIDLNSSNPSQNTFVEKSNIHPLMPFMGDSLLEGRHGQSLRFGSTAKSKSEKKNNWSDSGTNGDPITILRNGQPSKVSDEGWVPITENIKNDLSSIYLTSHQQLPFSIANENFYSTNNPPTTPSQYISPQIILNSNRIVLNAKSDSVLISGQTSVYISSNKSINLEAEQLYIDSTDIRLGSKIADQAILKGDDTVELLKRLITEVTNLSTALKTIQIWPGGVPSPDPTIGPVSKIAESNLERILFQIDSIKSTFVKTI